jgi:hypothetical protein
MQTLQISSHYHRFESSRTSRKSPAIPATKQGLSTAILILFLAAVIVAGVSVIAVQTGFVGAIGPALVKSKAASVN